MLQVTRMSPLQFTTATAQPSLASRLTFATPPSAAAPTDADAGGAPNRGKIVIGSVIAVLAVAAITLAATRKSTFAANAKTPAKKRAYMKGYRAGRKFCG